MAIDPNIGGPPAPLSTPMLTDMGLPSIAWLMFFKAIEMVGTHFEAVAGSGIAPLTNLYQDVPDCELQLTLTGVWLILGVFDFRNITDVENGAFGQLDVNGDPQVGWATADTEFGGGIQGGTRMMFWIFKNVTTDVTGPSIAKLQAKTNVAGTGSLNPDSTKIVAIFLRPS